MLRSCSLIHSTNRDLNKRERYFCFELTCDFLNSVRRFLRPLVRGFWFTVIDRPHVSESTFYSQTSIIETAVTSLFCDSMEYLANQIFSLGSELELGEIALEIDGAWNRRGYDTSRLAIIHCHRHEYLNNKMPTAAMCMGRLKLWKTNEILFVFQNEIDSFSFDSFSNRLIFFQ